MLVMDGSMPVLHGALVAFIYMQLYKKFALRDCTPLRYGTSKAAVGLPTGSRAIIHI